MDALNRLLVSVQGRDSARGMEFLGEKGGRGIAGRLPEVPFDGNYDDVVCIGLFCFRSHIVLSRQEQTRGLPRGAVLSRGQSQAAPAAKCTPTVPEHLFPLEVVVDVQSCEQLPTTGLSMQRRVPIKWHVFTRLWGDSRTPATHGGSGPASAARSTRAETENRMASRPVAWSPGTEPTGALPAPTRLLGGRQPVVPRLDDHSPRVRYLSATTSSFLVLAWPTRLLSRLLKGF